MGLKFIRVWLGVGSILWLELSSKELPFSRAVGLSKGKLLSPKGLSKGLSVGGGMSSRWVGGLFISLELLASLSLKMGFL